MNIGYAELFLVFAGVISFQSLSWGLGLAGVSLFIAFGRFALQVQEKQQKKQNAEEAVKVLNEQAEELAKSLGKIFSGVKEKKPTDKKNKYDTNLH